MFNRSISDPYEIPLDERRRSSTDICCTIVAALFALTLFAVAIINFNRGTPSYMQKRQTRSTSHRTAVSMEALLSKITEASRPPCFSASSSQSAWASSG